MSVPVLTAVSDQQWEAAMVGALDADRHGVHVVRRCVDVADLLGAASAGLARAAVLSGDLRRLDREALTRLSVAGVAVVGVVTADEEHAERRLRQLGIAHVLPASAGVDDVAAAVRAAAASASAPVPFALAHQRVAPGATEVPGPDGWLPPSPGADSSGDGPEQGVVVAVWGPAGSPGRTSVAVGVAAELAELGVPALLIDADTYGGVVAQLLGLLDEAPGLAAACRLANNGALDLPGLAALALEVRPGLRVLTGVSRADRWPEVRPSGLEVVLALARRLVPVTVVDCGFCLERDEELSFDTAAPRRNGATLAALADADTVVAVAAGDPVGLQRFVRGYGELLQAVPEAAPTVVVNRVRAAAVGGGDPEREIAAALQRFAGLRDLRFVRDDPAAYDAAVATGRTVMECAPRSPARVALRSLAADLGGVALPARRRRVALRRRG